MTTTNILITNYLPLARKIAQQKKRQLFSIYYDELESAAYFGLVDAAHKYNPRKNDNFVFYAKIRILGAIQDYLRELQWGSRRNPLKKAI